MTITDFVDLVCSENQIKKKQIVVSKYIPETHQELRELRLKDAIFYSNTGKEYCYHGIEKIKGGFDVAIFFALGATQKRISLHYENVSDFYQRVEYTEEIKDLLTYLSNLELIKIYNLTISKQTNADLKTTKTTTAEIVYKGVIYNLKQVKE